MLNDSLQRQQATDPRGSFIVQAPAGSGKTEILTQRYLRLLSTVQAPEQIIALTFTRKAANEMRERIVQALDKAANGVPATSSHQAQTLSFATSALDQDRARNWQILQQPSRLRVMTIDALCQSLSQAIPLQEKQVPYAQVSDQASTHYLKAARATLSFAIDHPDYQEAIKTLLLHLDNRQDRLLTLCCELLGKRDQWLQLIYHPKAQDKRKHEQALSWILAHELTRLHQSLPPDLATELVILSKQLAVIDNNPESPRTALSELRTFQALDQTLASSLASAILTSQGQLRKAFDHHVGLKRGVCENAVYDELKQRSKDLLAQLQDHPDFLVALVRVIGLPDPTYDALQWTVLQALLSLLPLLAAHLHLVFSEQNEVDFTAISEQALLALGDDESPTDLALYLDNSIHHLLVDEFQDTSIQQFQLLTKLVQGWQPNEPKTLFVVGDPMQSIYRFRAAEVGLFLRAKQQGIGAVPLTPLELSSNFRSTATVVDWVNQQFQLIFPQQEDIESGAISFHPSKHVKPADENSGIFAFQYENRQAEAQALVQWVRHELDHYPDDDMAILVRSRQQLRDIVQALREANIPFQGVDIDCLAKLPHLRDIWSLTQALLMPANRLAWLSLLRSPWCGLALSDLHHIARYSKHQSIYFALSQIETIPELSEDGRLRASFVYEILHEALMTRYQQGLIPWINKTLGQLHLDQILDQTQQDDLEQFWQLLERFEQDGQIEDITAFTRELNQLYSKHVVPSRLQIMTIHKSKGLEFDCVILPSLGSKATNTDTPLLRWLQIPSEEHGELLLLSPIKAAHQEHCLLYDYLGQLDAQKNNYESQRLLYVAATRAKKRLYLLDNHQRVNQGTFRHLLQHQVFEQCTNTTDTMIVSDSLPVLYHLPLSYYRHKPKRLNPPSPSLLTITDSTPRLIGIAIHALLQWICDKHPESLADIPWAIAIQPLKAAGLNALALASAQDKIQAQIKALLNDPVGQWIIQRHDDERNEYELLVRAEQSIDTKIIDRTFCEQGTRWIIDFKTGHEDPQQQIRYQQQVNGYAKLFANRNPEQPIQCGLYYLEHNHWITWTYDHLGVTN